ncbi:MAG: hypothetical protein M3R21_04705 [Candidatus Dormibacteraeota bacterium]|nr:hypothetical protein [Candidatus Dormibacteraeota bacterium]
MAKESSELAKQYIDASIQARVRLGRPVKPSKAAYSRAVRLARLAIEELTSLAGRMEKSSAATSSNLRTDLRRRSR